jgi:hypothetical protein
VLASIGWTDATSDEVWLAVDRDGGGLIKSGSELFGNATEQSNIAVPNGRESQRRVRTTYVKSV